MIHFQDSVCTPEFKDIKVSGLPATEFKCVMNNVMYDSNYNKGKDDTLGLVGIIVVGEKRPYVFWAADITTGQKEMDTAIKVLEAAVENFKEGN